MSARRGKKKIMATLQKTSNQCEAREKNHGYASENNQSVRSAVRRRIQTLGRAGTNELYKMQENTQTVGRAGRHVPSTRGGENWDTCYK